MRLFLLFLLLFIFSSCQEEVKTESAVPNETLAAHDFDQFYDQFHADTAYQMEHIIFPLEGLPANASAQDIGFYWEKFNWRPHVKFDAQASGFSSNFTRIGELVVEQITHKSGQYGMTRRFAKLTDGQWYLIYYKDMNPV